MRALFRDHAYRLYDAFTLAGALVLVVRSSTRYWLGEVVNAQQSNIYVAVSAVAATLLGFMIAALTILLMLNAERVTRRYRESGLYGKTLMLFHESAVWLTALTVSAIAGLFVDPVHDGGLANSWWDAWVYLVCALATAAAWRLFYSLWVLRQVMGIVGAAAKTPPVVTRDDIPPSDELTAGL
jgi:hypothetical protein